MNAKPNNLGSEFNSADEAFEYLVEQRLDEKRKALWAEELGQEADPTDVPKTKNTKVRSLYLRIASAAALLLLLAGFFLFFQNPEPLHQYAEVLIEDTDIKIQYGSGSRGGDSGAEEGDVKKLKAELTSTLLDEDFNQSLGYFKQLEKITALNLDDKYYYSVVILKSQGEDYQKAIRMLSDVIEGKESNIQSALWYRALAYGLTDNAILMKNDLRNIRSSSKRRTEKIEHLLSKY